MNHNASQRSFTSRSVASTLSAFGRELFQEETQVAILLPRGVKAPCSARAAGSQTARHRRYDLTVCPGWLQKDSFRDVSSDFAPGRIEEEDGFFLDERALFRHERVRQFQVGSHFPALVSPRLVPVWKKSEANKRRLLGNDWMLTHTAEALPGNSGSLGRPGSGKNLLKPTISNSVKHRPKCQELKSQPWFVTGARGASDRVCDRVPSIHLGDQFGALEEKIKQELQEERLQRISDAPIVPAGAVSVRSPSEQHGLTQQQILLRRHKGQIRMQDLKRRYEERLGRFQRQCEERGKVTSFERYEEVKAVREQHEEFLAAQREPEGKVEEEALKNIFATRK